MRPHPPENSLLRKKILLFTVTLLVGACDPIPSSVNIKIEVPDIFCPVNQALAEADSVHLGCQIADSL